MISNCPLIVLIPMSKEDNKVIPSDNHRYDLRAEDHGLRGFALKVKIEEDNSVKCVRVFNTDSVDHEEVAPLNPAEGGSWRQELVGVYGPDTPMVGIINEAIDSARKRNGSEPES